jgi:hypothetical protein
LDNIRAPHQSSSRSRIVPGGKGENSSSDLGNLLMISFLKIASKLLNLPSTQIQSVFNFPEPSEVALSKTLSLIYGSNKRIVGGEKL